MLGFLCRKVVTLAKFVTDMSLVAHFEWDGTPDEQAISDGVILWAGEEADG